MTSTLGRRSISATKLNDYKAQWTKRVTEIPKVISAEQLAKAREYDRIQRVAASTQPAAAPATQPTATPTTRPAATTTPQPTASVVKAPAPATQPATQPAK